MPAPDPVFIADPYDPRLAGYVGLTDRQLRRQIEGTAAVFVAEGPLAVEQLVASRFEVASVLVGARHLDRVRGLLAATAAPLYVTSAEVLAAVAGFNIHRGVVALGRRRPDPDFHDVLADAAASGARTMVVTEGINDHENLGAIFRNAAAFSVGAVLMDPTTADPLYRRCVRVSLGHALGVPFARLHPWPGALAHLRAEGWTTVALTPAAGAESLDGVAGARLRRVAVLLGAEGPGLRAETLDAADRRVRIPLAKAVDSLNVATAAAIALHHLAAGRPGEE
ncbi:MAG: RNA methyltransferase [Actinomycetota bacterium]|nr:RNA methyltransferase [Actinomycetota bacterium]